MQLEASYVTNRVVAVVLPFTPNCVLDLRNVRRVERASLKPRFLHTSLTGMPASASFRKPMICPSEKRLFYVRLPL